ncbi:hypothetical protein [Novosphingobium decolorationis]|uniref:Methyl-accepting chemotaxis protein n=1 Tax=Novosphingobium decolorationis TaxID=2698673 RepID=A0ABX8E0U0_9SPHN|nr:hypothetical protein [Novosphingobium decolorationis]QVM82741.1 hypothetical protein HT578_02605 [Novosphingobium decolorationis]
MASLAHRLDAGPDAPDGRADLVRQNLAAVAEGLNGHFDKAGLALGQTVETIDIILTALREVAEVFAQSEATVAIATLRDSASRLGQVAQSLERRGSEIAAIHKVSRDLRRAISEVQRCLQVLQIYAMNVKIAASGAPDFVNFADEMNVKLGAGNRETDAFSLKLAELDTSITSMQGIDARLLRECRKVIPQVPDRLARDAEALASHQDELVDLAEATSNHARAIQGELASALTALQVGDRARQRLEHVCQACTRLDEAAGKALSAPQRGHVLALLHAQVEDTADEYARDTRALVAALQRLRTNAEKLTALQDRDTFDEQAGALFLRRMEDGIAEAAGMIGQLHEADVQAEATLGVILATVATVTERVAAIRNLRVDVRQMAINIGLRCRKTEVIGRPVSIIANEIRSHSDKLDTLIAGINTAEAELVAISERMRTMAGNGDGAVGTGLSEALATIRDSAQATDMAMATVEQGAIGMAELMEQTQGFLAAALQMAPGIAEEAQALAASPLSPAAPGDDGPLRLLLEDIAGSYTMAGERSVHNRFLRPGMVALNTSGNAHSPSASDDGGGFEGFDDFDDFDDGLF